MGLVRSLQPWGILLIYCNNQLKKYIPPLLRLARGALSVPLLMSMSEAFSVAFHTIIKLHYTNALEWSSLVPGPEPKSSSLEKMNLKLLMVSYLHGHRYHWNSNWSAEEHVLFSLYEVILTIENAVANHFFLFNCFP